MAAALVNQVIESASSSVLEAQNGDKDDSDSVISTSTETPPPLNHLSDHSEDEASQSDLSFPPPPPEVLQECQEITDDILQNCNNCRPSQDKPMLSDLRLDSVSSHDLTYDETSSVTSPVADELTFALDLSSSLNVSKGSEEGFEHPEAWTSDVAPCAPEASTGAIQKTNAARMHRTRSTEQTGTSDHVTSPLEDLTSPDLTLSASGSEEELLGLFDNKCSGRCVDGPEKDKLSPQSNGQCLEDGAKTVISSESAVNEGDSDPAQVMGQAETSRSSESDVTSANTDVLMAYDSSSATGGEAEANTSSKEDQPKDGGGRLTDSAKDTSMEDEVFVGYEDDEGRNVDDVYENSAEKEDLPRSSAAVNIAGAKNMSIEIDSEGDVEYSGLEALDQQLKRKLEGQDSVELVKDDIWDFDSGMDQSGSVLSEENDEKDEGVDLDVGQEQSSPEGDFRFDGESPKCDSDLADSIDNASISDEDKCSNRPLQTDNETFCDVGTVPDKTVSSDRNCNANPTNVIEVEVELVGGGGGDEDEDQSEAPGPQNDEEVTAEKPPLEISVSTYSLYIHFNGVPKVTPNTIPPRIQKGSLALWFNDL